MSGRARPSCSSAFLTSRRDDTADSLEAPPSPKYPRAWRCLRNAAQPAWRPSGRSTACSRRADSNSGCAGASPLALSALAAEPAVPASSAASPAPVLRLRHATPAVGRRPRPRPAPAPSGAAAAGAVAARAAAQTQPPRCAPRSSSAACRPIWDACWCVWNREMSMLLSTPVFGPRPGCAAESRLKSAMIDLMRHSMSH
ncbi:MAG: hypothetical protein J3K34DRAFT_447155 [Monoraphidium minutum]|nr:MAG: hypothetical protein J3K34DRAFT_447155 [Monoraphidium minutum]